MIDYEEIVIISFEDLETFPTTFLPTRQKSDKTPTNYHSNMKKKLVLGSNFKKILQMQNLFLKQTSGVSSLLPLLGPKSYVPTSILKSPIMMVTSPVSFQHWHKIFQFSHPVYLELEHTPGCYLSCPGLYFIFKSLTQSLMKTKSGNYSHHICRKYKDHTISMVRDATTSNMDHCVVLNSRLNSLLQKYILRRIGALSKTNKS